jgi:FemAB-related protein (PEP-CTERM system-associated)
VKSPFLGRNLVSVPYGVYGGALSQGDAAFEALARTAGELGARLGVRFVELRHREPRPGARAGTDLYVTFRRPLPGDPDAILPAIPKRARAEVRKARDRFGLQFEETTDLREFYWLFARNKRRLGSPSLPLRWFRGLCEEFGADAVVHLVRTPARRAIAGVVSFCWGGTVYAYYSGSAHGSNHTGVNDFVYCRLMEWSARKGYATFDFGRSRRDTGPAHFKRNMGFVAEPLHYEYLLLQPGAEPPQFHPSNPRLKLPQRLWSHLPLFLTVRLGGRLSRYLP